MNKRTARTNSKWYKMDVHIHTAASSDFQQPQTTMLEILQRAEAKGMDIIGITDHNTVSGYRKMAQEINQLEMLKGLNRLLPNEKSLLDEYNRLLNKILVLPGFEFTATFGFHILALFSPSKSIREVEHLLLNLNIPEKLVDEGASTVGATTDVLQAYQAIHQAGGLVIAAHANSSNGVAMRGFNFGGQTKIAYTQDPNLHALEVTDLEQEGRRTTASFFNGTKPEYPRRMHCIQGSDSHRLTRDINRKKNLGVGDRATEILLEEKSFEAILNVLSGNDFSKTRPLRELSEPSFNFILSALEEGANIIQDFHPSMTIRGGKLYAILADICAFSNTNGGTLYIGVDPENKNNPPGVPNPQKNIELIEKEVNNRISPPVKCEIDVQDLNNKKILRAIISRGEDAPYALDENKIYIREEAETSLAVRDEIVGLVMRGKNLTVSSYQQQKELPSTAASEEQKEPIKPTLSDKTVIEPKTGIELLPPQERNGTKYFVLRDLRNGNTVKNVTQKSARRLWQYAIKRYNEVSPNIQKIDVTWQGNYGIIRKYNVLNYTNYDLVYKQDNSYRYFFGVTSNGIHGPWKSLVGEIDD